MKNSRTIAASTLFILIGMPACADPDDIQDDEELALELEDDESMSPATDIEIPPLVELELETGHRLVFYDMSAGAGDPDISIDEVASDGQTLITPHLDGVTTLELFESHSGGAQPPDALVAAHAIEAEALGRDDDSVVPMGLEITQGPLASGPWYGQFCASSSSFDNWWFANVVNGNYVSEPNFYTVNDAFLATSGIGKYGAFMGCNNNGGAKSFSKCTAGSPYLWWSCTTGTTVYQGNVWFTYKATSSQVKFATKLDDLGSYGWARVKVGEAF